MKPKKFVSEIRSLKFEDVFNPYSDHCPIYDVMDAPKRRASALSVFLERASDSEIDSMWIGRDLGYRGGRRTGLALTDDVHLANHASRWNADVKRATKGAFVSERTAAVIWKVLSRVTSPVFLWNVFPLHPHEPDKPFSNRAHTKNERRVGEELLSELVALLKPRRIVALGNDATETARRICADLEVHQVRHPSYGGQREFVEQATRLYSLSPQLDRSPSLWS